MCGALAGWKGKGQGNWVFLFATFRTTRTAQQTSSSYLSTFAAAPQLPLMTAATLELELGSVEETELLGAQLAEVVERGDVIFLSGELGAGKTSLSRGFLRRFFADPELEVPSPSYLICLSYADDGPDGSPAGATADDAGGAKVAVSGRTLRPRGRARLPGVRVLHLDPYRLPEGRVAGLVDLQSAFETSVCLVEWPQRLGPQLCTPHSPQRVEVRLGGIGPQAAGRAATVTAVGPRWAPMLAEWVAAGRVTVELPPLPPPALPSGDGEVGNGESGDGAGGGGGEAGGGQAAARVVPPVPEGAGRRGMLQRCGRVGVVTREECEAARE